VGVGSGFLLRGF